MTHVERAHFLYRDYCEAVWFSPVNIECEARYATYAQAEADLAGKEVKEVEDMNDAEKSGVRSPEVGINRYYGRE